MTDRPGRHPLPLRALCVLSYQLKVIAWAVDVSDGMRQNRISYLIASLA